jgi:hypothetical protein
VLFVVVIVVFPAVALDVLVSFAPMLAPPGAKVVVVVVSFVVVALAPVPFTVRLPVVVVAFCGKQGDCTSDVVVTLVPPPAAPTAAPLGAGVTAVSLEPPVACTGTVDPVYIKVSSIKRIGKAAVAANLSYILNSIAVVLSTFLLSESLLKRFINEDCASTNLTKNAQSSI